MEYYIRCFSVDCEVKTSVNSRKEKYPKYNDYYDYVSSLHYDANRYVIVTWLHRLFSNKNAFQ